MKKMLGIMMYGVVLFFFILQTASAGGVQEEKLQEKRRERAKAELMKIEEIQKASEKNAEMKTSAEEEQTGDRKPLKEGDTVQLTVDSAVDVALARNLNIKSETITLRVKRRTKNTVFNYFYPTISVSGTLSRMNKDPGTYEALVPVSAADLEEYNMYGLVTDNPFQPGTLMGVSSTILDSLPDDAPELYGAVMQVEEEIPHTWNLSTSLSMSLMLSAQLVFGIKATILDYESGRLSLETAKKKLARDVKKQFYNILLMEEQIELMRAKIATAEDRYEQARINYENGLVSEYNKLRAQVALENMRPGLEDMLVGYQSMLLGFKQQLGLPNRVDIELEGSIEAEPIALKADPLIDAYITNRLDIQSLVKQLEILRNSRDVTIAGMTPSVALTLSFDPAFANDPFEDPWFEDVENDWAQRSGMFGITVSVPLQKLLPFSSTWVELANTKDNIEKMQTGLMQAVRGAELEIETTVMKLKKSLESIEAMKMNVDLAKRAYDMAEEAYNAGNRELLEVKDAEDDLRDARVKLLAEKYNYSAGLLDLEYALNVSIKEIKERN